MEAQTPNETRINNKLLLKYEITYIRRHSNL
jgi:hypothetical protein